MRTWMLLRDVQLHLQAPKLPPARTAGHRTVGSMKTLILGYMHKY